MADKKTLYDIKQEYLQRINELEEKDFVLDPEDEEFLAINQAEKEQKAIAYLEVIRQKEDYLARADNEIKRLQAIVKRENKHIDRLSDTLLTAVNAYGAFTVGFTKFGIRKSKSVYVEPLKAAMLPKEYVSETTTTKPDLKKIKEALNSGVEIDGCEIKENTNLKIN